MTSSLASGSKFTPSASRETAAVSRAEFGGGSGLMGRVCVSLVKKKTKTTKTRRIKGSFITQDARAGPNKQQPHLDPLNILRVSHLARRGRRAGVTNGRWQN